MSKVQVPGPCKMCWWGQLMSAWLALYSAAALSQCVMAVTTICVGTKTCIQVAELQKIPVQ